MSATKHWHMRVSWSMDELAGEMVTTWGYRDKTALLKSLVRHAAVTGLRVAHRAGRELANEPPSRQDKIDAEILRMWRAGERVDAAFLRKIAEKVAAETGVEAGELLRRAAQAIAERAVKQ